MKKFWPSPCGFSTNRATATSPCARLIDGLNALAEQGFFIESFTPEVCRTLIQILLMSHMTWLKQTVRGTDKNAMSKTEFLRAHWLVLGPYLTEKGREAYRAMQQTEN